MARTRHSDSSTTVENDTPEKDVPVDESVAGEEVSGHVAKVDVTLSSNNQEETHESQRKLRGKGGAYRLVDGKRIPADD